MEQESNDRQSDEDGKKDRLGREKTMFYHLKAAHALHYEEVQALKLQVKELKRKLMEDASREVKCTNCETIKDLSEKKTIAFEEKLREKNKIICELKHKLELNEMQMSNGPFEPTNNCAKKRKLLLSRKDYIKSKENQESNPSSDDDVKILAIKSDCTIRPPNHSKESAELTNSQPDKQCPRKLLQSDSFVFVPDTLVEDMGIKPWRAGRSSKALVVPETLNVGLDSSETESPIFNNNSSRAIANHTTIDKKSATFQNCASNEASEIEPSRIHGKEMCDLIANNHELTSEDSDFSIDEFQVEHTKKGKFSKSTRSFEHQVSKPTFGNKPMAARKERTPSPRSKYKMHFSPARPGHRRPRYKQTTLTQQMSEAKQDMATDRTSDYDLKKAIEESLWDNRNTSQELLQQHINMSSNEQNDDDDSGLLNNLNDSCLDATFVSSQILRRARSNNQDLAISKSKKLNSINETKLDNFVADSPDSEGLIQEMLNQPTPTKQLNSRNSPNRNLRASDFICVQEDGTCIDDFDIVPNNKPPSPNYKYKESAVRKQNERRKLDGFECRECAEYMAAMGLSDEEKKKRLKECSRHRGKYALPATPDHFWSIDFPSTQECKERGVMNATQYKPLQRRRRLRK